MTDTPSTPESIERASPGPVFGSGGWRYARLYAAAIGYIVAVFLLARIVFAYRETAPVFLIFLVIVSIMWTPVGLIHQRWPFRAVSLAVVFLSLLALYFLREVALLPVLLLLASLFPAVPKGGQHTRRVSVLAISAATLVVVGVLAAIPWGSDTYALCWEDGRPPASIIENATRDRQGYQLNFGAFDRIGITQKGITVHTDPYATDDAVQLALRKLELALPVSSTIADNSAACP